MGEILILAEFNSVQTEANREGVEAIVDEENEEGEEEDKSTMSTSGWIALGVCVGLAVLVIAGIAVCICRKNRRDQSRWKRGSSSSPSTRSPPQAEFGGGSIIKWGMKLSCSQMYVTNAFMSQEKLPEATAGGGRGGAGRERIK